MAYYWSRLGVGHASLRSRYWWYPAAAGIGRTVWRAMLLGVLYSTAVIFGFIQTTSTPGRFFWGWRVLLFHDLAPPHAPLELSVIYPHTVQDDGEFSGHGDDRTPMATCFGHLHTPGFQ